MSRPLPVNIDFSGDNAAKGMKNRKVVPDSPQSNILSLTPDPNGSLERRSRLITNSAQRSVASISSGSGAGRFCIPLLSPARAEQIIALWAALFEGGMSMIPEGKRVTCL